MKMRGSLLKSCLVIGSLAALSAVVAANDVADRERCIAKGNTAKACDCYVAEVNRKVQAKVKPETYRAMKAGQPSKEGASEDMSAMGVLIEANIDAAKSCGVRLK